MKEHGIDKEMLSESRGELDDGTLRAETHRREG
jgi:hypothetical protein